MSSTNRLVAALGAVLVVLLILNSTVFIVDQRSDAIVFTFQKVREVITEPGLHVKWPYPIDQVVLMDKRVRSVDTSRGDKYLTSDKHDLLVDMTVKWQIVDPVRYYESFRGDPSLAADHLIQVARAALNQEIARRTVGAVIASDRAEVASGAREHAAGESGATGVQITAILITRVDFASALNERVFERMKGELERVANEKRARGAADEERIKADADRQRVVIEADANEKAQVTKGEGDARAAQIYAEAYGHDPQFYDFYKSLEAYRASFAGGRDLVVVDPSSDFFKYMRSPGAAAPAKK